MPYCSKCGASMKDDDRFCPTCGAAAESVFAFEPSADDAASHKGMGVLCYIGVLALIPYFSSAKNNSPFLKYHALSGLNLFLLELIAGACSTAVSYLISGLGGFLGWITSVAGLVFSIIGIVTVCNGQAKPLPLIGTIKLVKE